MIISAYILSSLAFLFSLAIILKPKRVGVVMPLKLFAMSFSLFWTLAGLVGFVLGMFVKAYPAVVIGVLGGGWMLAYILKNTWENQALESAFGEGWADNIPADQLEKMVLSRWAWHQPMKAHHEPGFDQDVVYWTLANSGRQLLCDIWQPADGKRSGLTFIYAHGSGWWVADKDFHKTTRPLFRHLVAQGHTVMDIAYRLCPEVQLHDMVADVKRAVAWMRENAENYGVDPQKIVLAGGSAGGHLALLSGYTPNHPELTPPELQGGDDPVHAIATYYPPVDLVEGYYRYNEYILSLGLPGVEVGQSIPEKERFEQIGRIDFLLGGLPEDVPEMYRLASPLTHVNENSPPTLLMQGSRDVLVPHEPAIELHQKLQSLRVPSVCVIQPWTEHAYDLLLPQFSPPAQNSLFHLDRFLAIMLNRE